MKQGRVNLSVSRQQLDLLTQVVAVELQLWQRTYHHHMGQTIVGHVEDCSDEFEAQYMYGLLTEFYSLLSDQLNQIGINEYEELQTHSSGKLGCEVTVYEVTRRGHSKSVYACDERHGGYLLFSEVRDLERYLDEGDDSGGVLLSSFRELDLFLRHWGFE